MAPLPFLIAGGGIAGPAAGLALARAGFEAVVCEASAVPRDEDGAFFNLAPNGIAVLQALGVAGVITSTGFRNDRLRFENERGQQLAEVAVGGVTMMRGALSRGLREAAVQRGIRFEFGKAIDTIDMQDQAVIARFSDGTSMVCAGVIGADGIHSRTRDIVMPGAPPPAYTGIINLGGIARTDLPSTGDATHMVFGRRAFFGYAVRPTGDTYWFSNYAQADAPARGVALEVESGSMRDRLLELHRDDPPEVLRILRAVSGHIGAYPIYDMPSLSVWHRGHICLIGDAAHAIGPHVGQGASLALEDAVVLAACLRDAGLRPGDSPARAFAAFEASRRPRVEPVVRQSRQTGRQKAPSGWLGRKLRDLVLPIFLKKSAAAANELYAYSLPPLEPVSQSR